MQEILSKAGVSVTVDWCGITKATACQEYYDPSRLFVQLIRKSPRNIARNAWTPLALSVVDGKGGAYAKVFLDSVKSKADEMRTPWGVLLAYAAAHEVGHLLLGGDAHTGTGLMKPQWDLKDYIAMAQDNLLFSQSQRETLRRVYGTPQPVMQASYK